ncbi:MAG: hypothetical protein ACKO7B_20370, partial [Flavobacteriales bacterium]
MYLTSSFQKDRKEYREYKNGVLNKGGYGIPFALVESSYHCFQSDTLALSNMLKRLLEEGDTNTFVVVLNNLEQVWKEKMIQNVLGEGKIELGFIQLVDLGLMERAEKAYLSNSTGAESSTLFI